MSELVSRDGTNIAFEVLGHGTTAVVLVAGALCHRSASRSLAERLSKRFTVVNYDRRGRGESGDTSPYAIDREVEDVAALIDVVGGSAAVYGHSSGAALALHAAASGVPITRLVLHEPPYGPDDDASTRAAQELAANIDAALAQHRRADAIALFCTAAGLPPETVETMTADPDLLAMAPTLAYDFEIIGDATGGGGVPEDLVRAIHVPTLSLAGTASPDFFQDTAKRIAELLPNGTHHTLEGQDHGAPAEAVAPVVEAFLSGRSTRA